MADTERAHVARALHDIATFQVLHTEAMRLIARTDDAAAVREVLRIVTSASRTIGSARR